MRRILFLALTLSSAASARTSSWAMGPCTIYRTSIDGAVWSVQRQNEGALLTVTKPKWALPKGEALDINLYFLERYFGHYRPAKAHRRRGSPSLTIYLDEELLLAFNRLNAVRIKAEGDRDLTGWLDLDGSSEAYRKLAQCSTQGTL